MRELLNLHGGSITYVPERHVFEVLLPLSGAAPISSDEPDAESADPVHLTDRSTDCAR